MISFLDHVLNMFFICFNFVAMKSILEALCTIIKKLRYRILNYKFIIRVEHQFNFALGRFLHRHNFCLFIKVVKCKNDRRIVLLFSFRTLSVKFCKKFIFIALNSIGIDDVAARCRHSFLFGVLNFAGNEVCGRTK